MSASIPASMLEKFTTFGDLLRFLRRHAGITQMELSIAVGYSDAQISRLEQNLRLPDIPTLEARFVPALGLGEEPKAVARLLDLAANVRREDAPAIGLCPYKGLNYFDEADSDLFVGREALTAKLVKRVLSLVLSRSPNETRFLAIVGASGSGKSSLVRAGLVSALRWNKACADWHIHVFTPTAHPLESLAVSLTHSSHSVMAIATLMDDLAGDPRSLQIFVKREFKSVNNTPLLLVIDQFEELFTLCHSEEEQAWFINNLLTASSEINGSVMVVIALRADFYAHCANYIKLREALAQNQEYIGAMNDEELKRAIEEPAQRSRWEFESGLVNLLLHDVGHEPGALPLLSHALFETWQRRRGRTMTLSGYASSGGVRGAIAETAETVFTDQFTQEQQQIARRIFLRLTELSDETATADTRRRATFDELILNPEEAAATHAVLKALADARLITTSEDSAEVAHEVLIRDWPTLRGWLEDNRESLRLHRQLTDASQEWSTLNCEPDMLFRGARLIQTREWAESHNDEMNTREREFLNTSMEFSERETREREAQRQRELEAAQRLAEAQQRRAEEQTRFANQMRQRARYLAGAFIIVLVMAGTALSFSNQSNQNALDALNARATAVANRATAMAYEDNAAKLINVMFGKELLLLNGQTTSNSLNTYSPNKKMFATKGEENTIHIWDVGTNSLLAMLKGHTDYVSGIAFSPDGTRLASSSLDGTAIIWDLAGGKALFTLKGHTGPVENIAFSPDGKRVVTSSDDSTAIIWDATTGDQLITLSAPAYTVLGMAYSPDGTRIATANQDGTARIWDAFTGRELLTLKANSGVVISVAFSLDGKWLVAVSNDGTAKVWNAATGDILYDFAR